MDTKMSGYNKQKIGITPGYVNRLALARYWTGTCGGLLNVRNTKPARGIFGKNNFDFRNP
jgi:hypothetical protein